MGVQWSARSGTASSHKSVYSFTPQALPQASPAGAPSGATIAPSRSVVVLSGASQMEKPERGTHTPGRSVASGLPTDAVQHPPV
jgi:hypothetical protein